MNVLVPVNSSETIQLASEYGENVEFYAGFEDNSWYEHFGQYEDMNRMSAFRQSANMSIEHLRQLVDAAKKSRRNLYITVNAGIYSLEQERFLKKLFGLLRENGVDGIILGDPNMAKTAKTEGLKIVASTMTGVYNAGDAALLRDLGFDRIIFPRDLSLEEMKYINDRVSSVEYECFLMRNGCRYADSHCLARHSDHYGALCGFLDHAKTAIHSRESEFRKIDEARFNHYVFTSAYHKMACGLCAIWDCIHIGMTAGKIVGRADGYESVKRDVEISLQNIEIARNCDSREEYLRQMQMPKTLDWCMKGCNCYYPEVRF